MSESSFSNCPKSLCIVLIILGLNYVATVARLALDISIGKERFPFSKSPFLKDVFYPSTLVFACGVIPQLSSVLFEFIRSMFNIGDS